MISLKDKVFLTRGKRSLVYAAKLNGKSVVIKEEKPGTGAVNRIENEAFWLEELNKHGIGPKLYLSGKGFVVMGYVHGERILDWMSKHGKADIKLVLKDVLFQCRKMDELNVSKEEMHNPYKHILISGKRVVMIDFERCHRSESPKNVRQFCQFLMSRRLAHVLVGKGMMIDSKRLISMLKVYKVDCSMESFSSVLEVVLP